MKNFYLIIELFEQNVEFIAKLKISCVYFLYYKYLSIAKQMHLSFYAFDQMMKVFMLLHTLGYGNLYDNIYSLDYCWYRLYSGA